MNPTTERIRALNDELRRNLPSGHAVMTAGVAALGPEAVARSSFEADGQQIFFKIDYFDKALAYHSPDPSDPSVTERVITIMLAEEY